MLIMSAAPKTTSAARLNHSEVDRPKPMVATPKIATELNITGPTRRSMGNRASHSDISSAPTAGAERSRPRPQGPVSRMSLANTGSSAVAPLSSTASMSIDTAPNTAGRLRIKRKPASSESNETFCLSGNWRAGRLSIRLRAQPYNSTAGP